MSIDVKRKGNALNIGYLRQRQGLPLESKILKSVRVIEKFWEENEGDVYISKGGVDSNVVEWIAKNFSYIGQFIECATVASVEPVENTKHNYELGNTMIKFVKDKKQTLRDWGYPLISKEVAMAISRYTRTKHDWVKNRRLNGYMGRNGKIIKDGTIPKKYQHLIYAPFELSEKCCINTKEAPLTQFEKKTGKKPITGELASESKNRQNNYLKHGCIMHKSNRDKCTPLGFWTSQDIMECIYKYKIKIPSIYGEVIKLEDGSYKFSGEQRTGCETCGFGIMFDKDRFERLRERKPALFNDTMRGGEWIRKDLYRWVKFRPNSMPIWSNLYWVPDKKGWGYKFVLNYFWESMYIKKKIIWNEEKNIFDILNFEQNQISFDI